MYSCNNKDQDFFRLYNPQFGRGIPFYASTIRRQRGSGIGGIFGAIGRKLLPLFKNYILPSVLPAAKSALKNISTDIIENKRNFKESLKEHGIGALKEAGKS